MKANNHRFNSFINKTAIGVLNLDRHFRIININNVASKITGYPKKDLLNKRITDIVTEESEINACKKFNRLIKTGNPGSDFNLRSRNGKTIQVRMDAVQISSNKYLAYWSKYPEQYESKTESGIDEDHFRTIVNNMPVPVVITRLCDGRMIYANSSFDSTFGIKAKSMVGRKTPAFKIYPNVRKSFLERLSESGSSKNYKVNVKLDDGKIFWVSISTEPIFFQGEIMLFNSLIDITEQVQAEETLKKSEEFLNKAQEIVHLGHWKLNPVTGEGEGSDELFRIYGLSKDEATFEAFVEVIHPEDREFDVATIKRGIDYGEDWNIKHRLICRDGTLKWIQSIGEAITDESGKTVLLVGTVQDITKRKKEEERKEVINNISREMNKNIGLNDFCDRIRQELNKVLPADNLYLSIYQVDKCLLQPLYFVKEGQALQKLPSPRTKGSGLSEYILKMKKGLLLDGQKLNDFRKSKGITIYGKKAKSWLGVPLMVDDKAIGVLSTFSPSNENAYCQEDLDLLSFVGAQIGSFIERKKAEEALKKSEENFRGLFENTVDEVYLIDVKSTKLLNVNSTACKELGYTKEYLIGKKLEFISGSSNFKKRNQTRLGKVINGSTEIFEGTQKRKDGTIYPVEVKAKLVEYVGRKAILGLVRDITQRLKAEEAIRDTQQKWNSLINNSNDMIAIIGKDERIQFLNHLPKSVTEAGLCADKFIGLSFYSFIIKDDIPKARRELRKVIREKTNAAVQVQGTISNNHYDCRITPIIKNGKVEGTIWIFNDITEKLKAEEALRLSEDRYRMLYEKNLSGVYRADLGGVIVECNDAFARIIGFKSKDEVIGRHARKLYQNLTDEKFHQKLIEQKGSLTGYESHIELNDKRQIWVLENASILDDKDGVPKYILGTIIDTSELKEAEQKIEYLAKLPEENPNPIFRIDKSTLKIIYANKAGKEILNDLTTRNRLYAQFRKTIRETTEKVSDGEAEYWVGNKCFLFNFNPVDNQNYINLYGREITEHKRMELMRGTSFRITEKANMKDMEFEEICAAIHQELNKVIDAKNFYVALGNKEEDIVTIPYYRDETEPGLKHLPFRKSAKGLTEYILKKGTPQIITGKELQELSRKGKIDDIRNTSKVWMGVPMHNDNLTVGLLAVQSYTNEFAYDKNDLDLLTFVSSQVANIIQRTRSREELILNQEKLAHVNQELETFIYKASHDLKGPLCSTQGLVNIAQNEVHDKTARKYINLIGESINKAQGILDDLAAITVIQQGQSKIEKVDFEKLANRAIQSFSFHPRFELTKFKVNNNLGKALYTDRKLLDTIMRNLVQNAIKYASINSDSCEVNVIIDNGKNGASKITVKDNGIGIPKEFHEKIFDMFFRASQKSTGSGLGLYIAKSAIEKLGGEIKVTSENLKGCEFSFWLPDAKHLIT